MLLSLLFLQLLFQFCITSHLCDFNLDIVRTTHICRWLISQYALCYICLLSKRCYRASYYSFIGNRSRSILIYSRSCCYFCTLCYCSSNVSYNASLVYVFVPGSLHCRISSLYAIIAARVNIARCSCCTQRFFFHRPLWDWLAYDVVVLLLFAPLPSILYLLHVSLPPVLYWTCCCLLLLMMTMLSVLFRLLLQLIVAMSTLSDAAWPLTPCLLCSLASNAYVPMATLCVPAAVLRLTLISICVLLVGIHLRRWHVSLSHNIYYCDCIFSIILVVFTD